MTSMTVQLRGIPDTAACIGRGGVHCVIVDRPAGVAGGQGLGFNGGQLLALAIGGCLCNDLHYVAHEMGVRLTAMSVAVTVAFEGDPLLASGADVQVAVEAAEPDADLAALIQAAQARSTVANSIGRGVPVSFSG